MASIGLDGRCITEEPPEEPDRLSLCAHSHKLWVNAVLQFQAEGTALFDIVRPSLLISSNYAQMDLRAISEMKRVNVTGQMVKDGRALLRCSLSLAADTAPKVLQAAPVYAKALLAIPIGRPDLTGAAIGALGLLHYAWRALLWWRRRREARRASLAAEVDAAARWVLVELREHAQRWQSVSGSMSAPPLPPSGLRARVPHAILSNRSMWKGVASRVRSDESVRVVPAGSFPLSGSEKPSAEEGWIFSPSSGPLSPGYASPPGYTSPVHRRHTSPGRPAPVR